jgi:hypothetical protein
MNLPNYFLVNGRRMRIFSTAPQAHNHTQLTLGVREPMIAVCVPHWFLEQGHGAISTSGTRLEFIDNEEPPRPL